MLLPPSVSFHPRPHERSDRHERAALCRLRVQHDAAVLRRGSRRVRRRWCRRNRASPRRSCPRAATRSRSPGSGRPASRRRSAFRQASRCCRCRPFPGPDDPEERIASLCASVRRLAPFEPETILCLTGPVGDRDPQEARKIVVEGLREVARAGEEAGVRVALEPIHASARDDFTIVGQHPRRRRPARRGQASRAWGSSSTRGTSGTRRTCSTTSARTRTASPPSTSTTGATRRVAGTTGRFPATASWTCPPCSERWRPAGFDGWYELEIFSTETYPDSLLKLDPAEIVRRGKAGFLQAWNGRH